MCRIAGIIDFNAAVNYDPETTITAMRDSMKAGGPDDAGNFICRQNNYILALGHRRLSIIDLSACGHQPMSSANESITLIFNGEIYNYKEIKEELLKEGYTFSTNSDTEVIIQAYEAWGIESINRFIGMFAFLLFDNSRELVYAVRDRAGVKPLYYYHHENLFLFGSELKSFHHHPGFIKEINVDALALYLQFSYIPTSQSIYKNVFKVLPGHYKCIDLKQQTIKDYIYWSAADKYNQPFVSGMDMNDIIDHTEDILISACNYRMVADVPVGVFLSGGYDSTLVTALLQKDRTEKIKTFSIGFHEDTFNEAPYAKKVAGHLGTEHTEYYCTQKDALDIIPLLPDIYDDLLGDSSAIATTLVSKIAKQSVKVALSADGGDELFAGYDKYSSVTSVTQIKSGLPAFLNTSAGFILEKLNPEYLFNNAPVSKRTAKLSKMLHAKNMNEMLYWFDCANTSKELSKIIDSPFKSPDINLYSMQANDEINSMLGIDYTTYLADDILIKVDRATMSVGLEGREPLLDHRLLEWMSQVPGTLKIKKGIKKYILKEIVHRHVPRSIMDRKKMGFGVPITIWFKKELKDYFERYLNPIPLRKHNLLSIENIEKKKRLYYNGNDRVLPELWNLLMFQMWYEKWMT